MKILQLIVSALLFILAGLLCIGQVAITGSLFIGTMFAVLWAITGALLYMSWLEVKGAIKEGEL